VRCRIAIWLAFGAVVLSIAGRADGGAPAAANAIGPTAAAAHALAPPPTTRALQARLARLGFLDRDGVDGQSGPRTTAAVVAFQKWARLPRDGSASARTRAALARTTGPVPITTGRGRRFEVLLDRQLVFAVEDGRVVRVLGVSTGTQATPTPTGSFRIAAKLPNWWSKPFGEWLAHAMPFAGGVAMHASVDVPAQAASHGCVRLNAWDAQWAYDFAAVGDRVTVIANSQDPGR
jgi:lipoprotein-anchoring transpeptidase ErfK/SrfK